MDFEKIVIAPQIVVYKNIFKNSNNLIDILENDNEYSLFTPWEKWYEQGYRKNTEFNRNSNYNTEESSYLNELCNVFDFVKKDYFDEFQKENGIWPDFIKDWDEIKKEKDVFFFDYFKYDISKEVNNKKENLAMEYHVDDYLLDANVKMMRHVATANLYLNDQYSGGEICAYDSISDKSYMYKPKTGDMVVMPSTRPFYHAVKVFRNHDRYFLRNFFDYFVDGNETFDNFSEKSVDYIKSGEQQIFIPNIEERVE
jgi:hypothetical protein